MPSPRLTDQQAVVPTDLILRAQTFCAPRVARTSGLRTGYRFVHIFNTTHPHGSRPVLISDAAINARPDLQTRRSSIIETKKLTAAPVAGEANAMIVPDVVASNSLFKAFVFLTGSCTTHILNEARVPILLRSREVRTAAGIASAALAAIRRGRLQ